MAKPPIVLLPKDPKDIYALQALYRGEAPPDQQIRALKCIIEELAGADDMTFDPDNDRNTCFAEGRRSVGRAIRITCTTSVEKIMAAERRIAARKTKPTPKKG